MKWSARTVAAAAMETMAPFRGDASIPHAREGNFTAFIGGCWVMLGLNFTRSVMEFRPAWRRVQHAARCARQRLPAACAAAGVARALALPSAALAFSASPIPPASLFYR